MVKKRGERVYRPATEVEQNRHQLVREEIAKELPAIRDRAKKRLDLLKREGTPIRQLVASMKAERERQGLSLADLNERTGIDRAALSRLETNEDANPTLNTLERYASAIGKSMVVVLVKSSNS